MNLEEENQMEIKITMMENEKNIDEERLCLKDKICSMDKEIRKEGILEVSKLVKENQILNEEVISLIFEDLDIMFNENDEETQLLVIDIYFKVIENFDKKPKFNQQRFWYFFFDKFLDTKKKQLYPKSKIFFEKLIFLVDKNEITDILISFLMKNNAKIIKSILDIFCKKIEVLEIDNKFQNILEGVEKNLLNNDIQIRTKSFELLKLLVEKKGFGIVEGMKKLKPGQIEELKQINVTKNINIKEKEEGKKFKKNINLFEKDLYNEKQAVSILDHFPESWCQNIINTKKWKEKIELVEKFLKMADVPKLEKDNYHHIFALAKKLIKENIIHLQIVGLKMIGLMCKALRKNIHSLVKSFFGELIEKLKDKKFQIIEQLLYTINNCFYCLSPEEVYEEVHKSNEKRNRDIRMNMINVLKNYFDFIFQTNKKNLDSFFKLFSETINLYFKDQDMALKQSNNDLVLYFIDVLEDQPEFKILEKYLDLKNIRSKNTTNISKKRRSSYISQLTSPIRSPKKNNKLLNTSLIENHEIKLKINNFGFLKKKLQRDEVIAKMSEIFDSSFIRDCLDTNWKNKKNGIFVINNQISKQAKFNLDEGNILCQFLKIITNNFSESNLLINKEIINTFWILIQFCEDKETLLFFFIKFFIKKISEKKFANDLENLMKEFHKHINFYIIFNFVLKEAKECNNPKILIETNKIFANLVDEKSCYIIDNISEYFSMCFNNNNPEVRTTSIEFFQKYAANFGPEISKVLEKIENKKLRENLQERFKDLINVKNIKIKKKTEVRKHSLNNNESEEKRENLNYGEIVEKLNSGDWKQKRDALENFEKLTLENPKYFSASHINDTFNFVFRKFRDANKLVSLTALGCLKNQLKHFFKNYKFFYKKILFESFNFFMDKNCEFKNEILLILEIFKENNHTQLICDTLLSSIIKKENIDLKFYLFNFLENYKENLKTAKEEVLVEVVIIIVLNMKKIKDFENIALLESLTRSIGEDVCKKRLSLEKPLIKEQLKLFLNKIFKENKMKDNNFSEDVKPAKKINFLKKFDFEEKKPIYLNSVLNFTEPLDMEISNLHNNLINQLNPQLGKKIFSFESKVIEETFIQLTEMNIYTLNNIILFYQVIYIRIYDTTRRLIINTFENFLKFLINVIKTQNYVLNSEKEVCVIFHAVVRFYLNSSVETAQNVLDVLPYINQHQVFDMCFNLFKNKACFDNEEKIVVLFKELSKATNPDVFLSIEFVNLLMNLKSKYPQHVLSIFQYLQKNLYFQKFLEKPEFKTKFDLKLKQNDNKEINFADINCLVDIFQNNSLDLIKLSTNMIFIVESILNFSDDLIIYQKYTEKDFQKFDTFLFLMEKACYFKNLFDCLNNYYRQSIFEKLVTYLLILDTKKTEFTFERDNSTLLSSAVIIQKINSIIIRILERNDPNILYDTLFKIIEKCRLNLLTNKDSKLNEKMRKIIIKLTVKILRLEEGKLLVKVDLQKLLSLLNLYYGRFKNEADVNYLKGIKTIVSDLVLLKGLELFKYYEYVKEKKEPGFLLIINRFLDKYKEKEDIQGTAEIDKVEKIINCFKNY